MTDNFASPARQQGASLVEAMVGTLLIAVLLAGVSYALSRTLISQRYMNAQTIAVLEMRELTQREGMTGLCSSGTGDITVGDQSVNVSASDCSGPQITITVNGIGRTIPAGTLPAIGASLATQSTAQSQQLFGGDGVLRFSH